MTLSDWIGTAIFEDSGCLTITNSGEETPIYMGNPNFKTIPSNVLASEVVGFCSDRSYVNMRITVRPCAPEPPMTVPQAIEHARAELCDNYCKYPAMYVDVPDGEEALIENHCEACPMMRLL